MNTKTNNRNLGWIKYIVVLAALIALYQFLPLDQWINSFREWTVEQGPAGWIITIIAYAIATVLVIPGAVLTIGAGLAYGLWAFPLVVIGATLGASLAFLCGRYFARDKIQKAINQRPKFKAVDSAIKDEGWKIVGLMRLSPAVPFNLQNWLFGATAVEFWPYTLATFFGIMPGTLLYVWIGSLGGQTVSQESSTAKTVLFVIGIIATLAVTIYVGKKAREKLKKYQ